MEEEVEKGYAWETEYERTWEALREDESGSLQASIKGIVHRAKRKHLEGRQTNIRLGMMRHLYLIVDLSAAMLNPDLKPSRAILALKLLEGFVIEFFDQNPISQLGIMMTMNKRAEKCTELSGNLNYQIEKLQSLSKLECSGEPSLQNTLEMALQTLRHLPSHTSREILVIMGSLTSCDPSNINDTISRLSDNKVRCSIIGLAAEVRICKQICQMTGGQYDVIMDEHHFKDLLNYHVTPPPSKPNTESSLIRMGFPFHRSNESADSHNNHPSMCMCHLDSPELEKYFSCTGYYCPQCKSKYCELPVECKACGLTLVSAPHLARSYRHLFPLPPFKEILVTQLADGVSVYCYSCQTALDDSGSHVYQCDKCFQYYCNDCDTFIHESLQTCPSCASRK